MLHHHDRWTAPACRIPDTGGGFMDSSAIELHPEAAPAVHVNSAPLSIEELRKIDAYWRACNYLAAGMIYLRENPLLREPLKKEHIKSRLLGHWGSSPGLSFSYIHLNRLIKKYDLDRKSTRLNTSHVKS